MFEVKQDSIGEWYWVLKAPNGSLIARSFGGYESHAAVMNSIASVQKVVPTAEIHDTLTNPK
jgi:uncharacterized protein YegP (UPF0339 family)